MALPNDFMVENMLLEGWASSLIVRDYDIPSLNRWRAMAYWVNLFETNRKMLIIRRERK